MPNNKGRYYANLSPYYFWLLTIEAWLKNRSLAEEAGSLLQAKLGERAAKRDEMLSLVADRLGMTRDRLQQQILDGTIAPELSTSDADTDTNRSSQQREEKSL